MPLFIPSYELVSVHKLMLSDRIRTGAFCNAVSEKTELGSVVADLGSGTGVLSLAAARAGAGKVYAVEKERIALVAREIVKKNGLSDRILIVNEDSKFIEFSEKVDLLVSEWIGVHVFQENMLNDFIAFRDKVLKPGGKLIPDTVDVWLAPLKCTSVINKEILKWKEPVEGFDFSEIGELSLNDTYIDHILPGHLAAEGVLSETIDLHTIKTFVTFKISEIFYISDDQEIEGICGWFKAHLTDSITIDTSPHAPTTHWCQAVYPIYPKIKIRRGESLKLDVVFEQAGNYVNVSWSASVVGREKETSCNFSTKNNYTLPGSALV